MADVKEFLETLIMRLYWIAEKHAVREHTHLGLCFYIFFICLPTCNGGECYKRSCMLQNHLGLKRSELQYEVQNVQSHAGEQRQFTVCSGCSPIKNRKSNKVIKKTLKLSTRIS